MSTPDPPPAKPPVIDYARPVPPGRVSLRDGWFAVRLAAVPSAVGLAILLLFALTRSRLFVAIGVLWLLGGGLTAFVAFLNAVNGLICTRADALNGPEARRLYAVALAVSLASLPVAIFCMEVGKHLRPGWGD